MANTPVYLSSPLFGPNIHERKSIKVALSHPVPWDMWESYCLTVCTCVGYKNLRMVSAEEFIFLFSPDPHSAAAALAPPWPGPSGTEHCALGAGLAAAVLINLTLEMALLIQSGVFQCL